MEPMTSVLSEEQLEAARRRAFDIAYRMLGSVSEAEDIAQEAVVRLAYAGEPIDEPAAWVTTAATRLSIDVLRSARSRRETYVGPWLPEPLIASCAEDAAAHAEVADSLSQAFLVMLERLSPTERAAFLLREVFDYDYAEIARILDRSEVNSRQIVTRAKKHLGAARPRFDADPAQRDRLLDSFLAAADEGDVAALEALLADDAVLYADGGGKAIAARKPISGAGRIARVLATLIPKTHRTLALRRERTAVNGQPGAIVHTAEGAVWNVLTIDVLEGRIQTVRMIRNPDKLAHLPTQAVPPTRG
jgi:RNA polymerase sigma-70 factor, ECF subfamily